jgi:hypothetical protein
MSYEGSTSRATRSVWRHLSQGYSSAPLAQMTASYQSGGSGSPQRIKNTFNLDVISLQSRRGYTTTSYSDHLGSPINSNDVVNGWCMVDSNSTLNERWYPPYSMGIASVRFNVYTSFSHNANGTSGLTGTVWSILEW